MNTIFAPRQQAMGNGHTANGHTVKSSIPEHAVLDIREALERVGAYGSIEIFVQDHTITQITARSIRKTKHALTGTSF